MLRRRHQTGQHGHTALVVTYPKERIQPGTVGACRLALGSKLGGENSKLLRDLEMLEDTVLTAELPQVIFFGPPDATDGSLAPKVQINIDSRELLFSSVAPKVGRSS
uniref:Uncharacterized protein n=1 Tax=Trichuris muris TaxID=70415 RepID=A0A5S6Q6Z5_TRIMR